MASRTTPPAAPAPDDPSGAWLDLADLALRRAAVLGRLARGRGPDDLAGIQLSDTDVDAVLLEVTGGSDPEAIASAAATMDPLLAHARRRFAASLDVVHPFSAICANANLGLAECEVLALVLAVEMDVRRQRLVSFLNDDASNGRVTLQTLGIMLGTEHPGAVTVGFGSGLRRAALIDVQADGPWATHTIVPRPSLLWALVGEVSLDPELPAGARFVEADDEAGTAVVVVTGSDRLRRHQEAARRTAGRRFLVVDQPADPSGWAATVCEATVSGAGIIVEIGDELSATARQWIDRAHHLPWAISTRVDLPLSQFPDRRWVEFLAPDHDVTDDEWDDAFGPGAPKAHRLSPEQVELVGKAYAARHGDFDAAVRRLVSGRLEKLARRIRPSRTWDDIVLAPEAMEQLRGIVDRYRFGDRVYDEWGFSARPSRGLVALFSGSSGTGKTMATEIIAGDLGLDVFKLDLSAVVSKYIGETERNLEEIFEAASAGNLVLFFDEADSLFGKRSEVKDARDRYANIEVSYLLQRLEAYDGVVILASNFEKNIDEAFVRRIHARVEFAVPKPPERRLIWKRNLPDTAPVVGVDVDDLADRFELSGGSIRNAAVHAAFLAASEGSAITMEHTVRGVGREYRKMGKLIKADDFGPFLPLVTAPK
jgi:AAA+ superfamily predicted ATPase